MPLHMTTATLDLPFPAGQILWGGFDLNADHDWLAIVEGESGKRLVSAATDVALAIDHPNLMLRWLGDAALVVAPRVEEQNEINAWVVDRYTGGILNSFAVGDGVDGVAILDDFIAVGYFDEGVFSGITPSHEGLAVFDREGAFLWGYHSDIRGPLHIVDCYAICPSGRNHLVFCAYTKFEWVELDLAGRTQTVIATPPELAGCKAITPVGDIAIFHAPYRRGNDKTPREDVLAFDTKTGAVTSIGALPGRVRGLSPGRLLAIGGDAVTVATFTLD